MKHRICVLDDEMFIADSLGKLLRQSFGEEAEVFVTYSAERAAEAIRSKECDIALADIQMPGISGLEMLRRLRQENNQVQVFSNSCRRSIFFIRRRRVSTTCSSSSVFSR